MGVGGIGGVKQVENRQPENVAAKKVEPQPQQQIVETASRDTRIGDSRMQGSLMRQQLEDRMLTFNNPAEVPSLPPQTCCADEKKVADALATIRESLSEGTFDWDVSHGDLKTIENELKNLNSDELNRVFEQMSPDELKKYASELEGSLGGYSADEKKQLFDHLAKHLSGANLSKLASAMNLGEASSSVRPGQTDEPLVNILARSVSENAAPEAKAEFVKTMAANADKHQNAGVAAAQVLASMKDNPALLEQTLSQLTDTELQSIVDGAARKTEVSSRGGKITNYDPEPLTNLLDAVATLKGDGAAAQKARLFEASANKITEVRENAVKFGIYYGASAENAIRNSLNGVINSDTEGVVKSLKENNIDGKGITAYLKSLINTGDNAQIGRIIARLSKGNDVQGDARTRFGARTADDDAAKTQILSNAQVLGYFGGGLLAATRQVSGDAAKQADMLKTIFGTITGGVGAINPELGVAGAVINGLSASAINDITSQLAKGKISDAEAMQKLLIPRESDGALYRGETEKGEFINWSDHVVVSNP